MLPADAGDSSQGRTAAEDATVPTVFAIGPDKRIKMISVYPMSTGRNFDEVLRVLDSIQLTAKHQVATPVNRKPGEDGIIVPSVPDEKARRRFQPGLAGAQALPADRPAAALTRMRAGGRPPAAPSVHRHAQKGRCRLRTDAGARGLRASG